MANVRWLWLGSCLFGEVDHKEDNAEAAQRRSLVSTSSQVSCVVPIDDGPLRVRVTEESRRRCVAKAQLIEAQAPLLSDEDLRSGPPSNNPVRSDEDVYCRLMPIEKSGGSLKFRCLRTDEQNRLYDEDGELVPDAAAFDADGDLLDALGKKIRDKDGKARRGDELRVKYFLGPEPAERYREMFTETVVSRLFWAIGIPVDRVYMPPNVQCFGCSADPFGQMVPQPSPAPRPFRLASVKRTYEGRKIALPRARGILGFGGKYDHGFSFQEIGRLSATWPDARRIEAEVLALALNLVGYNNLHSYQNDLRCRKGMWDRQTGVCSEVVAYVSDVGGTLGGLRAFIVKGWDSPKQQLHPRGDFITFSLGGVFSTKRTCELHKAIGDIRRVSEAAREHLDRRIRGRLGREQLRIIFETANIHRMDSRVNGAVAAQYKLQKGPDLDRAVQLLWADELEKRLNEILTARC